MKSIIRNILINSSALFLTSILFQGLVIEDTLSSVLLGGMALTVMHLTVKPILSLVALPFNFLTLGGFSLIINAFILYLLTILVPTIQVADFTFKGANILGVVLPRTEFTMVTSILSASFLITVIKMGITWTNS